MIHDVTKDDEIVEVRLPLRDYKIMREMIEERQAMNGMKKLLTKIFWIASGLLSLLGLFEVFRRFGE
jgi:5-bromo-4-chloroindolyl phosphate hydrolysis protein